MKNNVDFILSADWHLRDDQPLCRTDDYFVAQEKKIDFICDLQREYDCPILHAGDLFHKAKSSKFLEIWCLNKFSCIVDYEFNPKFTTIPGNHDLPNHSILKLDESSIGILAAANRIDLESTPLDTIIKIQGSSRKIGMMHSLIHRNDPIKADGKIISKQAKKILKDNPDFDIIISGDNHQTFVEEYEGRLLVNPGSLMRYTAGQIDHKPCVFLYSTRNNTVVQQFIPIKQGVIDREHLDSKQDSADRFDSFIRRMNDDFELSLSFQKNIEAYLKANKTRKSVIETIWEHVS